MHREGNLISMFFQKKIDRAMRWLKEKNENSSGENIGDQKLEKKDILALIISALLVFGPIFVILIAIILLVYY